jgi:hypothetical protein
MAKGIIHERAYLLKLGIGVRKASNNILRRLIPGWGLVNNGCYLSAAEERIV